MPHAAQDRLSTSDFFWIHRQICDAADRPVQSVRGKPVATAEETEARVTWLKILREVVPRKSLINTICLHVERMSAPGLTLLVFAQCYNWAWPFTSWWGVKTIMTVRSIVHIVPAQSKCTFVDL